MKVIYKLTEQLRAGDIVSWGGNTAFRILEDARPTCSFHGPSPVAVAKGECLSGRESNYYWPGSIWNFQGRVGRVTHRVLLGE
jgi:hypothetical protein